MKQNIKNAYIALLSGIAEIYKGGVKSIDEYERECFIHFPNFPATEKVVVKWYWKDGTKRYENEYQNGQLHGLSIGWRPDGTKQWEAEWQNGQRHGLSIGWRNDGTKRWEAEYQNGKLINEKHY
jgi:hypothetical protein